MKKNEKNIKILKLNKNKIKVNDNKTLNKRTKPFERIKRKALCKGNILDGSHQVPRQVIHYLIIDLSRQMAFWMYFVFVFHRQLLLLTKKINQQSKIGIRLCSILESGKSIHQRWKKKPIVRMSTIEAVDDYKVSRKLIHHSTKKQTNRSLSLTNLSHFVFSSGESKKILKAFPVPWICIALKILAASTSHVRLLEVSNYFRTKNLSHFGI